MKYFILLILSLCLIIGCGDKDPTGIEGDKDMDYKLKIQKMVEKSRVSTNILTKKPDSLFDNGKILSRQKTTGWKEFPRVYDQYNIDIASKMVMKQQPGSEWVVYSRLYSEIPEGWDITNGHIYSPAQWVDGFTPYPWFPTHYVSGGNDGPFGVWILSQLEGDPGWAVVYDHPFETSTYDGTAYGTYIAGIDSFGIWLDGQGPYNVYFADKSKVKMDDDKDDNIIVWISQQSNIVLTWDGNPSHGIGWKYSPTPYPIEDITFDRLYNRVTITEKTGHKNGGRIFSSTMNSYLDTDNPWWQLPGMLSRISYDDTNGDLWGINGEKKVFRYQ